MIQGILIHWERCILSFLVFNKSKGIFIIVTFFDNYRIKSTVSGKFLLQLLLQLSRRNLSLRINTSTSKFVTNILWGLCLSSCSGERLGDSLESINLSQIYLKNQIKRDILQFTSSKDYYLYVMLQFHLNDNNLSCILY